MDEDLRLDIKRNFGQDKERAEEFDKDIREVLNKLQDKGLIEFKATLRRKCDYCEKTLLDGDKFKTIGDKDMCEDCQNK